MIRRLEELDVDSQKTYHTCVSHASPPSHTQVPIFPSGTCGSSFTILADLTGDSLNIAIYFLINPFLINNCKKWLWISEEFWGISCYQDNNIFVLVAYLLMMMMLQPMHM